MNIFISNKKLEHNKIEPFIHSFDNVYLSIDDDFEELNEFKLSEKNIKRIFDVINYSWDGTIYIFEKKDEQEVLKELSEWFLDSKNHTLSGENGIKNCLLLKHSQNHLVIVDTQRDDGTTFDLFMKSLEAKKPDFEKIKQHMVDNPVVLFFKGCDDGHVGKRFKTKEDAMEYLQLIDVFEDVFDEDLQYHN